MTDLVSDQLMSGMLESQVQPLPSDSQVPPATNMDIDDTQASRIQRRPGGYAVENIPRVIDETAMAVMETFEKFLET
jgi:DNA replication licensing factor MCM6